MSCEYLLLNGARINCQDAEGKTPLYLATELGMYILIILSTFLRYYILYILQFYKYLIVQDTLHKFVYF